MARYVLRVFRDNVTGWVPTILVVAVVTTLVGICMNQFVWTSSPSFTLAARQAGLDPAEFGMVSVTIYVVVSLLAFFSLTVVGSATVNRIHGTFAQWRLMGASPSQVLASMWMLVGVASLFGSLIGSLAAVPASLLAVPEFNAMAAESFADGFGSFDLLRSRRRWPRGSDPCCWVWPRACWARPSPRCAQRRSVPSR